MTKISKCIQSAIVESWSRIFGVLISDSNLYDKYLSIGIVICVTTPLVSIVYGHIEPNFLHFASTDIYPVWGIVDWLISYEGGFVRRGLTGEIVDFFTQVFNLSPNVIIVSISLLFYAIVVGWVLKLSYKKYPACIILSPILLGGLIFSGVLIRKDILIIFMFMLSLIVMISNLSNFVKYIIINFLCVIAILSHEMFFFIGLPMLIVANSIIKAGKVISLSSLKFMLIPIVSIILVSLYPGTWEQVEILVGHWNNIYEEIAPTHCCFDISMNAVKALADFGWHRERNLVHWTMLVYGFLWNPGIWVVIWFIAGNVLTKVVGHYDSESEAKVSAFYVYQTIAALPLFFVAWDYGRWIVLICCTSFIATIVLKGTVVLPYEKSLRKLFFWSGPLLLWQKILIIFLIGVPHLWLNIDYQLDAIPVFDFLFNLAKLWNLSS